MARISRQRRRKPYVIVFWEGESEKEYMKFMRNEFHEYLNLTVHPKKGTFDVAKKAFSNRGIYADDIKDVDAIWLIFDTEPDLRGKWEEYYGIVRKLRKKCKYSTTKLLMTKGCIEYYFLLHFEKSAPLIMNKADKEHVMQNLIDMFCAGYQKGDSDSISLIAKHYVDAIENGEWSLSRLNDELDAASDPDERDRRLFITDQTFTNVHECVTYLVELKDNTLGSAYDANIGV